MRAFFEKVVIEPERSWALLDRRLDDGIPFEWHHHPEYELTLTLNSEGHRYVGNHVSAYTDHDLVLVGANTPHTWYSSRRIDEQQPHRAIVVWFHDDWLRQLVTVCPELHPLLSLLRHAHQGVVFDRVVVDQIEPLMHQICQQAPDAQLIMLLEILRRVSGQRHQDPLGGSVAMPELEPRLQPVYDYLHEHYRTAIYVPTLAQQAHVSVSTFHRLFRQQTRMTVMGYVSQLRVGHACAELLQSRKPIAVIADQVGYGNLAQFNKEFKRLKGITPRQYRQYHASTPS